MILLVLLLFGPFPFCFALQLCLFPFW